MAAVMLSGTQCFGKSSKTIPLLTVSKIQTYLSSSLNLSLVIRGYTDQLSIILLFAQIAFGWLLWKRTISNYKLQCFSQCRSRWLELVVMLIYLKPANDDFDAQKCFPAYDEQLHRYDLSSGFARRFCNYKRLYTLIGNLSNEKLQLVHTIFGNNSACPFQRSLSQLKVVGFHLRTSGEFADSSAAHDSESRFPGDLFHAATLIERPPHTGSIGLVPKPDQIPSHMSVGQQ